MSDTRTNSGKDMGETVHKKESYPSKLVKKKKAIREESTDYPVTEQKTAGSTVKTKPNIAGEQVYGSKTMIVPGHETGGSDTTKMSMTCYNPKNQDSRASLAIHGSYPAQEPDHKEKLESDEKQRLLSSATAISASRSENVKDSKTKSKMSERGKHMSVLVNEEDSTSEESKQKMNKPRIGDNDNTTGTMTVLSNPTSEKVQGKKMEQESKVIKTKSKRALDDLQHENSKSHVSSFDVRSPANCPPQLKPSNKGSGNGDANSSQTSQSKTRNNLQTSITNVSESTCSMTAKYESQHQTNYPKHSNANLGDQTKQKNATFKNSPSNPSTQSLSDNQSRKPAGPGNRDEKNSKQSLRQILVNPTKSEMTDLEVDVVVSSEDTALQGYGMVAKQLTKKGGERYKVQKQMICLAIGGLKEWHFIFTPGGVSLKCKNVAHVNIPRLQEFDQETWCRFFTKSISRLLKRIDCMGFRSVAIPLVGTGRNGAPTSFVIDLICNQILNFSKKSADKTWLQIIYIVHPDSSIVKSIETVARQLHLCQTPEVTKSSDVTVARSKTHNEKFEKDILPFIERYSVNTEMVKSISPGEQCPICFDKIKTNERMELNQCHHVFCLVCIKQSFAAKPACPICNTVYGIVRGIQPEGCMVELFRKESLPGFDGYGTIHIYYSFPDGIQDKTHPNPGRQYRGTRREAFLPDNKEGQKIHRLLRKSFEQKLTFTIGCSRTTGRTDVVTWNDIHHKTAMYGGPERFGYPDPLYLKRVEEELAAKGILEETDNFE